MHDVLDSDFEPFEKFSKKAPKTGKPSNPRKSDHLIRAARKEKEKVKQAVLEESESEE